MLCFGVAGNIARLQSISKKRLSTTEIGERKGEATDCGNLGSVFHNLGQYEHLERALFITTEIGDRKGEAAHYGSLGNVFGSLGQYDKAIEHL